MWKWRSVMHWSALILVIVSIIEQTGGNLYGRNPYEGPCDDDGDCVGGAHCHENVCECQDNEVWDRHKFDPATGLDGRCAIPLEGICNEGEGWTPCVTGLYCIVLRGPSLDTGICAPPHHIQRIFVVKNLPSPEEYLQDEEK